MMESVECLDLNFTWIVGQDDPTTKVVSAWEVYKRLELSNLVIKCVYNRTFLEALIKELYIPETIFSYSTTKLWTTSSVTIVLTLFPNSFYRESHHKIISDLMFCKMLGERFNLFEGNAWNGTESESNYEIIYLNAAISNKSRPNKMRLVVVHLDNF